MALIMPVPGSFLASQKIARRCSDGRSLGWKEVSNLAVMRRANSPRYIQAEIPNISNVTQLERWLAGVLGGQWDLPTEALTGFASDSPELEEPSEMEWRSVTRRSHKAFKAAQAAGTIVASPMTAGHFHCEDKPIAIGDSAGAITAAHRFSFLSNASAQTVNGCQSPGSWKYPDWPDDTVTTYGDRNPASIGDFRYYPNMGLTSLFKAYERPDFGDLKSYLDRLRVPVNLHNAALDELHDGLYDLSTDLAELPETIKWGYSLLKRIVDAYLALRRNELKIRKGAGSNSVEVSREVAAAWMEFRYAVTPVVKSLEDLQKYKFQTPNAYATVRKRMDTQHELSMGRYIARFTVEKRVWAKGAFDTSNLTIGLGLNPIKSLWEVTPWSFMIGWVLPIGQLLGSLKPPTATTQRVLMHSFRVVTVDLEHKQHGSMPSSCSYYRAVEASPTTKWGISPDVSINWKRKLDALALSWLMTTNTLGIK